MQICHLCGDIVEKDLELTEEEIKGGKSIPICFSCLYIGLHKTLERMGNPIIFDEEDDAIYLPKGTQN